jgi:DDE superfamily endonuclease/Tc5 transposase DNA-binding domain
MEPAKYESRVKTAIQQAERGIERSLNAAADANGVARSTVKHRAAGRPERNPWGQTLLHKHQETQVIDWIRDLETWGFPIRVDMLQQMVNSIADFPPGQRGVGKNWATRFIKRNDLVTTFSRRLDSQRAFNSDPEIVKDWFAFYRTVFQRYKIVHRNMYNFDEKGILFGVAARARVILTSKDLRTKGLRKTVQQPGSRESVTIIETICADGSNLPPFIIWKGKQHQSNWYTTDDDHDRKGWRYAYSNNGWTDNELGVAFIEAFDQATKHKTRDGEYRLVVMDNHGSHISWQFIQFAIERRIVLLCLPPHSTHLLQPCDVGIFEPLQAAYGRLVDNHCRGGRTGVNKESFLGIFSEAKKKAFTAENISSAWRGTGLAPYNQTAVLKRLPTWEETGAKKTDFSESYGSSQGVEPNPAPPKTPKSVKEIENLFAEVQLSRTERPDGLLESPVKCKLEKLFKASIQARTDADIQREAIKAYEPYKEKKKGGKKVISKARVLTQEDVDRLKEEEEERNAEESEKVARRAYEDGSDLPEEGVALCSHAVLNPGEANKPWASQSHVFRSDAQLVTDGVVGLPEWNGRLKMFGGVGVKFDEPEDSQPRKAGRRKAKK